MTNSAGRRLAAAVSIAAPVCHRQNLAIERVTSALSGGPNHQRPRTPVHVVLPMSDFQRVTQRLWPTATDEARGRGVPPPLLLGGILLPPLPHAAQPAIPAESQDPRLSHPIWNLGVFPH